MKVKIHRGIVSNVSKKNESWEQYNISFIFLWMSKGFNEWMNECMNEWMI